MNHPITESFSRLIINKWKIFILSEVKNGRDFPFPLEMKYNGTDEKMLYVCVRASVCVVCVRGVPWYIFQYFQELNRKISLNLRQSYPLSLC